MYLNFIDGLAASSVGTCFGNALGQLFISERSIVIFSTSEQLFTIHFKKYFVTTTTADVN